LRYANNSGYKAQSAKDEMITREVFVSQLVLDEVKRIVEDSEVGNLLLILDMCSLIALLHRLIQGACCSNWK
jgi:hypothetical protein